MGVEGFLGWFSGGGSGRSCCVGCCGWCFLLVGIRLVVVGRNLGGCIGI